MKRLLPVLLLLIAAAAIAATKPSTTKSTSKKPATAATTLKSLATPVPPTAVAQDSLIRPGERHFVHLWQLTFGGENAEGYFSQDVKKLIWQTTRGDWPCDQMYVMDLVTGQDHRVSTGKGRCTCGYFYDHDQRMLWASTHAGADSCPPRPDYSHGYVWPVYPDYDIWTSKVDGSDLRRLTDSPGYDAEATVSTDGAWVLFTSERDGDLDLYKMHPDGTGLVRLTNKIGYDGGGWLSRDGRWMVWRAFYPADSALTEYKDLLARHLVRPLQMNLWVARADGSEAKQLTFKPGASFAPYFTPDGHEIIYSSNWENPRGRNFDIYLVDARGGEPEPVTRDEQFDGFPMFSPDGRMLVFASNRGGKVPGETNLYMAEWRP